MSLVPSIPSLLPAHLNVHPPQRCDPLLAHPLEVEAGELCSFVGKKANKQWLSRWYPAMEAAPERKAA